MSLISLIFLIISIFSINKYFGKSGLFSYNCIAVCLANIQILQLTNYHYLGFCAPLGTIVFTTTFFTNGLITKQYGKKESQKSILLSSIIYIIFSLSMILSLAHKPFCNQNDFCNQAFEKYKALSEIFIPSLRILISSLLAFIISQFFCTFIFDKLNKFSKFIPMPTSIFLSSILDHVSFTIFAFYIFSDTKPPLKIFFSGYIFGSYILRLLAILILTMASYLKKFVTSKPSKVLKN